MQIALFRPATLALALFCALVFVFAAYIAGLVVPVVSGVVPAVVSEVVPAVVQSATQSSY